MIDCITCEYAERDCYNRFVDRCSGYSNCAHSKFEGKVELIIPEMSEKEFDEATIKIFNSMRKQYPTMHMGDFQTIAMFSKMFKEEYLK